MTPHPQPAEHPYRPSRSAEERLAVLERRCNRLESIVEKLSRERARE